jgi:hypothetical protein
VLLNLEICDLELAHFIEFVPGSSDSDFEINVVEVKRDREWFAQEFPKMKEFWDSVLKYRTDGIESHPKYRKPVKRKAKEPGITLDLKPPSIFSFIVFLRVITHEGYLEIFWNDFPFLWRMRIEYITFLLPGIFYLLYLNYI